MQRGIRHGVSVLADTKCGGTLHARMRHSRSVQAGRGENGSVQAGMR